MRPNVRQQAQIDRIIKEEVRRGLQARREKQALLEQADSNELALSDRSALREAMEGELVASLQQGIDALVKRFVVANRWDPALGHTTGADRRGWEAALRAASKDLRDVVDRGVREIEQELMDGMYVPVGD